jgi:hypothetical protein
MWQNCHPFFQHCGHFYRSLMDVAADGAIRNRADFSISSDSPYKRDEEALGDNESQAEEAEPQGRIQKTRNGIHSSVQRINRDFGRARMEERGCKGL